VKIFRLSLAVAASLALNVGGLWADMVPVRHTEGLVHGFLVLRTLDGATLADGDLLQTARGNVVTSRLVFHFRDGSVRDETTVYSQQGTFRFRESHLIQKGPAFKQTLDARINADGRVSVTSTDDKGKEKTESQRVKLPPDLANGMVLTLLKNVAPASPKTMLSMLVFTPSPRVVKLAVTPAGEEAFDTSGLHRKAVRYVVKTEIGGVTGVLADVLGKTPPDANVWILTGEAPAFVKSESPFDAGGPLWRTELVSPVWP
jgi:hypothetical protein